MDARKMPGNKMHLSSDGPRIDQAEMLESLLESAQRETGKNRGVQSCGYRTARDMTIPCMGPLYAEMDRGTDPNAIIDALLDHATSLLVTAAVSMSMPGDDDHMVRRLASEFRRRMDENLRSARSRKSE